ncbi:helix-turn-helix domain-containing protein [Microbacterium sp. NPDC055910]|uniref:helix-turn-helix domain-containing protein n=1 Tax=Microbacterium sp. NPDC055910 TaxID=3345659 RepID=UPI0035D5A8B3
MHRCQEEDGVQGRLKDEVQVLVDRLAASTAQSVAIDDPDGHIIAFSRHYGDEDGYRLKLVLEREVLPEYRDFFAPYVRGLVDGTKPSPVRVPAAPELMVVGRIGYPIRANDRVIAILWFIDRGVDLPHATIQDYCALFADLLAQRHRRGMPPALSASGESVRRLLTGQESALDDITSWLTDAGTGFFVLASLDDRRASPASRRVIERLPRGIASGRLSIACLTRLDGLDVAVYGGSYADPDEAERDAAELIAHAGRAIPPGHRGIGLAGVGELPGIRRLYVEAALTAFVTRHLHRRTPVSQAETMQSHLAALCTPLSVRESPAVEALKTLLLDRDGFAFDTIGAFLHSDGTLADVVEQLRIHRTTLHYRTAQIEARTGLDVQVPAEMFLAAGVWLRVAADRSKLAHLLAQR